MNAKERLRFGIASTIAAIVTFGPIRAADTNAFETFRTTGYLVGLTQGTNLVTQKPTYDYFSFAAHNLVNLAMGRGQSDTNFPNQVMAVTLARDLSSASLVVYDHVVSKVVATIAASTVVNSVCQQDSLVQDGPNRAHFVAAMQINPVGGPTNGVSGGYFTVAGRVNLNPETGCPQPVFVSLDRDRLDQIDDDVELPASLDPDTVPLTMRTGVAHLIGLVEVVTDGTPHAVLVPYGGMSIRRELPDEPPGLTPDTANYAAQPALWEK